MIRIGLTGGIGSGKSVVATVFSVMGYPCYDSDSAMKRLYTSDGQLMCSMKQSFGADIYTCDGRLDSKRLADILFNDPTAQERISRIAYPCLENDYREWLSGQKSDITLFESAILFQAGLSLSFDRTIAVVAPEELRIGRVQQRSGLPAGEIRARMARQMSDSELSACATDTIINDGLHPILPQIEQLIHSL